MASHLPGLTWECDERSAFSKALIRTTPALAQSGLSLRWGLTGMVTYVRWQDTEEHYRAAAAYLQSACGGLQLPQMLAGILESCM